MLTLVVQTKAMVCATIFYNRSEGRSNSPAGLQESPYKKHD